MLQIKSKLTRDIGYVFYFGGVFLGPGFFYLDYKDFIEGKNLQCSADINCNEQVSYMLGFLWSSSIIWVFRG